MTTSQLSLLAIMAGAVAGAGLFLFVAAVRGLPPKPARTGPSRTERLVKDLFSVRGAVAVIVGIAVLLVTRWVVAGLGMAMLAYSWRGLSGAGSERRAMSRLEGLATWSESLRDTIAGAVGLEQAIPASTRVADASIREPLARLVDRLHTRVPMHAALRRFAEDLDDPSADMIIAALIINSRLRGPGLRDLLGALANSVREELDMRRKINSSRRSTRRSVQIVIAVSVLMAVGLAILDHAFLAPYDSVFGQLVLAIIVTIYALGIIWLRKLARFDMPQRLLGTASTVPGAAPAQPARRRTRDRRRLAGRCRLIAALVVGAVTGLALFVLVYALIPRRVGLARRIAAFDVGRGPAARPVSYPGDGKESAFSKRLGTALARFCAEQGWEFRSLRSNLALVGKSFENYLATKALLGLFGLIFPPILLGLIGLAGVHLSFIIPVWAGLIFAGVFFFLPDLELRGQVEKRQRDFRHAIGAFLDLVAMNLSGGRGVPEALMAASEIGEGWAFWRIRDALANARITGQTPWQALGVLGEEVQVNELKDLAAALSLVAEDGAKVRESLTARAVSLRRRELADLEGQAGEKSQSMLLAQMVLAAAFLVFLMYPAVHLLLQS